MAQILAGDTPGNRMSQLFHFATRASGTDIVHFFRAPYALTVKAAYVSFDAAFTGQASNYVTFRIRNLGTDGSGTTDCASLAASSTAVSVGAETPLAVTLSTTASELAVTAGQLLEARIAVTSSGQATDNATIQLDYEWT